MSSVNTSSNKLFFSQTAKGLADAKRCWSPRSLAAETIFIDLVIFAMFFVPLIRTFTEIGRKK